MKIGFVFTNYNNSKLTGDAVQSIYANENRNDANIVIVDNKSDEENISLLKEIKREYTSIHLIINDENIGYFKGLNVGIKYLRDRDKKINHVVIGNNDLIFPSDFISSIIAKNDVFSKFPVISPDILTLDGVHQNPHVISKINKFRELVYDIYYMKYGFARIINFVAKVTKKITDRSDEQQFDKAQMIWQGYGACYILGPLFFEHFDQLWAPSFLMGEEFFLSKQLEDENFQIFYEPSIIVKHHCHATVDKMPGKTIWKMGKESHALYRNYVKLY